MLLMSLILIIVENKVFVSVELYESCFLVELEGNSVWGCFGRPMLWIILGYAYLTNVVLWISSYLDLLLGMVVTAKSDCFCAVLIENFQYLLARI